MKVNIKKLNENAVIPTYKHFGVDMGMDVTAIDYEYDEKYDRHLYKTGLAFEIPKGYGMLIFPKSGNTKTDVYLANCVGILDPSYRGELTLAYKNRDKNILDRPYNIGDKVGQIVILPYPLIEFIEVDELSATDRGTDGGINRRDTDFKI